MNTSSTNKGIDQDRRQLLCTASSGVAIAGAASVFPALLASPGDALGQPSKQGDSPMATKADAIRPLSINFPEDALVDLRRRVQATKFPDKEQVPDTTQGVQIATMRSLARYWATDYDWRKAEARLNAVPNFVTEIEGLDIHFIHVRSKHEKAL